LAADLNHYPAINSLAICYEDGRGVEKDIFKAFELFTKAASEANHIYAIKNLASCYKYGKGCEKNETKVFELYHQAMLLGNDIAIKQLGKCYEDGTGVNKNINKAIELYIQYYKKTKCKIIHKKIGNLIRKDPDIAIELYSYKQKNEELEREIEHLKYCPGIGYEQAKNDYYLLYGNGD
jgi:hypothetical protein